MARYKHTDVEEGQGIFLSVNLWEQLSSGTFEYMVNDLIDHRIGVSNFDARYKNDKTGVSAIPPKAIIKLILYGYSKGVKSSRGIWELNLNNVTAKALTGCMEIHWTTIADFISGNNESFREIFVRVLAYCNELGLVEGKTFAIDGYRLPSNASIDLSGTEEELKKRLSVYRKMAERHKKKDESGQTSEEERRHYEERQKILKRGIEKTSVFLEGMEKKAGRNGKEIKSNVTDNESAVIHTSKGYIQGYIGMAVSDAGSQVVVSARAVGSANECERYREMIRETKKNMERAGCKERKKKTLLADSNYFSEENLRASEEEGLEAIIPDGEYKRRLGKKGERRLNAADFKYRKDGNYYRCPYGTKLEYKGTTKYTRGREGKIYQASGTGHLQCQCHSKRIKSKKTDTERKLLISSSNEFGNMCVRMKEKLNREEYQERYSRRIQIIEPVFEDISYCKGLNRFTLRRKEKANGQWQLYCIAHNFEKCLNKYNKKKGLVQGNGKRRGAVKRAV